MKLFLKWLKEKHPEVRLTPWQKRVATIYFEGMNVVVNQPFAAGKMFLLNLIQEYEKEV